MGKHVSESFITDYDQGLDVDSIKRSIANHIQYTLGKDQYSATKHDVYMAFAYSVRDRIVDRWNKTQQSYYKKDVKRVYYLSMEFLIGRTLGNSLINLKLYDEYKEALSQLGYDLEELREVEVDAGLGNGGLGRLASCYLDSMATLQIPGYGYGIRYEYGMFYQKIINGYQVENPDKWLKEGNPWEIERPEFTYPVKFGGSVYQYTDDKGSLRSEWTDTDDVMAVAYDMPVPGYGCKTVNTLRLWNAKSTKQFNLNFFNKGDYIQAVEERYRAEIISKVLYPSDNVDKNKELRLKQQYFFVSASLQDIIRRYKKFHENLDEFPRKIAVQLNDTHPAIAIPELMRILVDQERLSWERAWSITVNTFAYTNHTLMPEALEKWSVSLLGSLLPRHLQIIYEINHRLMHDVSQKYPGDLEKMASMSIIEESGEKMVRMANLAIIGSHSVNGVAELHSSLLKNTMFKDFNDYYIAKFKNKTNGITQRRWLRKCNFNLSSLISATIGEGWITDLYQIKGLLSHIDDNGFLDRWNQVKKENKIRLAHFIREECGVEINPDSMFDCQVKRIHEYKRQLLNVLHVIYLYNYIKDNPQADFVPRTVIFSGKAAPGYTMAKLIIKLINSVATVINTDPTVGDKLKVVFIPNYCVSVAEKIIPGIELSEQISTAGTEASGTGNMKFALNGALTIGTLDGANIEIQKEVGNDNIFIFGLTAYEALKVKEEGYDPGRYYRENPDLKRVIDMIRGDYFSVFEPGIFEPIIKSLIEWGDQYLLLADYAAYVACQETVSAQYKDQRTWAKKSLCNVANMGKFSSDRAVMEYAEDIWEIKPFDPAVIFGNQHVPA